jgi:catechol 2,3-dioxygenase-like lactoylglutathione lyase family enzyme
MEASIMTVTGMNHFTVLTDQLEQTVNFYKDVLKLEDGYRPPLDFPGAWLYSGGAAVLHIIAGRPLPEEPAGVLDHMAFSATGLASVVKNLRSREIEYTLRQQKGSNVWQLFCFDPSGAKVELDFDASEALPE